MDVDETSIGQEDRLPEGTASVGTPGMAPDENPDVEATNVEDSDGEYAETGRTPDGKRFEGPPPTEDPEIPEDIPSPQGDDIVAKQLREAAMAEQDPDLKAKLWEEYKRYKAGL